MSSKYITEANKKKERDLSIEEIASAIHCQKIISSLRNKYIDPLIIRDKNLIPKIKSRQLTINQDPYSLNKVLVHDFLKKKNLENEKGESNHSKKDLSNKLLPIIPKSDQNQIDIKKDFNRKDSYRISDSFKITSGMFKEYLKEPLKKIKLGCMYNNTKSLDEKKLIDNYYRKIDSIKQINDKYNLQLNLRYLADNNYTSEIPNKVSKKYLMNYLFKKYVTSSPTGTNLNDFDNPNKIKDKSKRHKSRRHSIRSKKTRNNNDEELIKGNTITNSIDSENNKSIDVTQKDISIDDNNTFITKLNIEKEKKENKGLSEYNNDISKSKKKYNLKLYENNKNIINHDQKITVDCVCSNYISKIEPEKLVYKSIDKTAFEVQNEPSYKRVKKFENKIDKIIKSQSKNSININKYI